MRHLQPVYTKARIYLRGCGDLDHQRVLLAGLRQRMDGSQLSAVSVLESVDGALILEVVGTREAVHETVIPQIEHGLPGAFTTLEAVCAFCSAKRDEHRLY